MRKLLIIFLLISFCSAIMGQTRKAFLKEAEKSFENKDYYSALSYYSEMLLFDRDLPTLFRAAESARLFDAYSIAQDYYAEIIERDSMYKYPEAGFYHGLMMQRQGNYAEAEEQFRLYISENEGENETLVKRAKKEQESCAWAKDQVENPKSQYLIEHLGEDVNSPYSDFGALEKDGTLYYSSLKYAENVKGKGQKLFSKNLKKEGQDEMAKVDSTLMAPPNTHIAHTTFNADATTMYYTLCEYLNDKDIRCELYQRSRFPNGRWREGVRIEAPINSDDSLTTTTMPHLTYDPRLEKEVLYFVSNRKGGRGGLDIYYSVVDDNGNFSQPMNLSGINSEQDDVTPFFHSESETLYFSSMGYLGLGGFDVYKVYQGGNGWGSVENLGSPLNSSYHDVYYTLNADGSQAYMSSNRKGSLYLDGQNEACCYDIYDVEILPTELELNIFTFDKETLDSLGDVEVTVWNLTNGEKEIFRAQKLEASNYHVTIDCDTEYRILATRPGYKDASSSFRSPAAGGPSSIDKLLYLEPNTIKLEVFTFDLLSEDPLEGCTVRLFNLTTGEELIAPANPKGNDFTFRVNPCDRYEIIASKDGYTQAQEIIEVPCDPEGDGVIRRDLFLTTSLLDMLPIYLYFDNDHPNPKTNRTTTDLQYSATYDAYLPLKRTFIQEYAKAYTDVSSTRADVEVSEFFDNEVERQYKRFTIFLELLEKELAGGQNYDIVLKGFASPRASSGYNKRLGSRRVDCVRNEFEKYKGGVLTPYISRNVLRISERSIGESQAPAGVSDDLANPVQSIFSPAASKERRVEIVDVKKVK